jgi:nitric oxide reductase subunit C
MGRTDEIRRIVMTKSQARAIFIWGTALSAVILVALTVNSLSQIPGRTNEDKLNAQVAAGKWVWQKHNCNDCHTILGIGGYYAPDLTRVMSQRDAAWMKDFLKDPSAVWPASRKMPNLHLSDEEITDLIAFLDWVDHINTNNWPPKPLTVLASAQENPGAAVFKAQGCSACHSMGGGGGHIGPDLTHVGARRSREWIEAQLNDPKSHNPNSIMPSFGKLPGKDREDLVNYLAGLK